MRLNSQPRTNNLACNVSAARLGRSPPVETLAREWYRNDRGFQSRLAMGANVGGALCVYLAGLFGMWLG
jgi:hypothetical protein